MENKIKKLIFGFFALMIVLTILSRVAASAMTAKVEVMSVKDSSLHYEITGSGIVSNDAKKYIELKNGYKIGEINIKAGQQVEEGDLLFSYDADQLEETKKVLEKELTKLELQYQKAGLVTQDTGSQDNLGEADRTKSNAKEDLASAQKAFEEEKAKIKKNLEDEYKTANNEWKALELSKEAKLRVVHRTVSDAEDELKKICNIKPEAEKKINEYKEAVVSGNEDRIVKSRNAMFELLYGDTYKDHRQKAADAEEILNRAQEDLKGIQNKWAAAINYWDQFSSNDELKKNYENQIETRNEEVKNAGRVVSDAQKNLDRIMEKDNKLNKALDDYTTAIKGNDHVTEANSYVTIFEIFYSPTAAEKEQIAAAQLKLKRAKEDEAQAASDWEKEYDTAFDKKEKLRGDLLKIDAGTYDYGDSLSGKAEALQAAKRSLDAAELGLNKAHKDEQELIKNKENNKLSTEIDLNLLKMDMEDKQKELDTLEALIKSKGQVISPAAGSITSMGLEQGMTLSGQEKLAIATGGAELVMTAGKDDMKYFSTGDKLEIKAGTQRGKISTKIENIELPDENGQVKFTALLPEGEYRIGGSMDFTLTKNSEEYRSCIPIQALRQDSAATFILIAKETNTVLGKEQKAFRLDVNVLSQDAKQAAIEASLSEEDSIIYSSNKNISEGDRVRIDKTE